jgi:hypothetical protein
MGLPDPRLDAQLRELQQLRKQLKDAVEQARAAVDLVRAAQDRPPR